ncbi:gp8 domain protein [Mycobacteroides abscessus subsp. bolletii 1513]|uniref:Gp8 domain protein n=1 Tax=Mycobacteroides abscessus subsp. bolletii 1513 TaxID=1299321 RepID=X8DE90_9MYCO|nr:gp8 domain protein [Mycobacteroides abscessus subsp. bolletii 1513]
MRVASAVDRADTPIRDLAALSRRLLDIAEDIAILDQLSGETDPIAHAVKVPDDTNVEAPALYAKARYVVPPENMVTTEWPSICEICRVLGIEFDDWQDDLGRLILAKRPDGLYASDTTAISIPRQSGKTYLIGAIVFALCIKYPACGASGPRTCSRRRARLSSRCRAWPTCRA